MDNFKIISWLWNKRGSLKCYFCNGSVISGNFRDKHGYISKFQCLNCNKLLNETTLAKHNGYQD